MSILDLFLRSSFGMSKSAVKLLARQHVLNLCCDLDVPVVATDVNFGRLRPGVWGMVEPCFNIDNKLCNYSVYLDDARVNMARSCAELDDAFIHMLVAAGHESRHLIQIDSKDPELALIYLTECGNSKNYKANYVFSRREIDAESSGLRFAQAYLMEQFPRVDGDVLLLRYVNARISDEYDYWIDGPEDGFKSLDDVFQAFDDAYDAAASHVNKYTYKPSKTCEDAFVKLTGIGSGKGINPDWEFMYDALRNASDARESNLILASAALYLDPGLIKYANGAELPDLSIQAVFGREPPSDPNIDSEESKSEPKSYARSPKMQLLMDMVKQNGRERDGPEVNYGPEK